MKSNASHVPPLHVFLSALALSLIAVVALALAFSYATPGAQSAYASALPAVQIVPSALPTPATERLVLDEASPRACCDHFE